MLKRLEKITWLAGIIFVSALSNYAQQTGTADAVDIRRLSHHVLDARDISPWMFVPQENVRSVSTTEHPGFATIWEAGKGKDIKGVLKDPIRIEQYPLPWEFHLG